MKKKEPHWTFESEVNLQTRIASDFLAQIEEKIIEKEWTHVELAKALNVTESRISQVFNNPGNLTLKTMMKMAASVDLMVSVVAYGLGKGARETGPVASGIFESCWKKLGKPKNRWDIAKIIDNKVPLTIEFVDELPGKIANKIGAYSAFYDVKKRKIVIRKDESIETLMHEIGHDIIQIKGGLREEHELFDECDCEGISFNGFARAVDAKNWEIFNLKKQIEGLQKQLESEGE